MIAELVNLSLTAALLRNSQKNFISLSGLFSRSALLSPLPLGINRLTELRRGMNGNTEF